MERRLAAEIARLLPKLPLRDPRTLRPSIAREQLVALTQSRNNVPLPQPAAVTDGAIPVRPAGSGRGSIARGGCRRRRSCIFTGRLGRRRPEYRRPASANARERRCAAKTARGSRPSC